MTKNITVKQDEQKPIPVEVLADSIKAISDGIKKLRAGPLTDKALVLLIQHAATKLRRGHSIVNVGAVDIRAVLDGMESLERVYLKAKKKPSS